MGKRHKKKTKVDKKPAEEAPPSPAPSATPPPPAPPPPSSDPPLKLVLKVGAKTQVGTSESYNILQENTASDGSTSREQSSSHSSKKKKKKKKSSSDKKDKKKDKTATKREYESYESLGTNSQEDEDYNSREGTTVEEDDTNTDATGTEEDMEITPAATVATATSPPKAKKALLSRPTPPTTPQTDTAMPATVESDAPQTETAAPTADATASNGDAKASESPANRSIKEAKDTVPDKKPLQKVLDNLMRTLQRKDIDMFFAWPVKDVIAPGYSDIIKQPMDFSTMKKKIDEGEYNSIDEFKADFNLMCNNATIYNGPDTIYYKAAKKMIAAGVKITKKERLLTLKRAYGYYEEGDAKMKPRKSSKKPVVDGDTATEDSSGVDGEAMETDDASVRDQGDKDGDLDYNLEEDTAEEILEQVLQSAKDAKDRLTARVPNSKIGFLRREKIGTTTLNILNPSKPGEQESRVVNLGMLTGRLTHGTGSIPGFREDKRNKVTPVSYLNYGSFSSFAPSFDSTHSNISKEESDLLYSTYGDQTAYHYAKSLQDFVQDCGDYAVNLVDNLLDTLTTGEHSKTLKVLEQRRKEEQKKKEAEEKANAEKNKAATKEAIESQNKQKGKKDGAKKANTSKDNEYDFDSLKTLSDLGIDMSFLPTIEKELKKDDPAQPIKQEALEMASKLNSTSALIGDLEKTQNERMSRAPPPHLSFTPGPSDQECEIAEKLTQQLLALTAKVTPSDVSSTEGVRRAMGIAVHPSSSTPTTSEDPNPSVLAGAAADSTDSGAAAANSTQDGIDKDFMDILQGATTKS